MKPSITPEFYDEQFKITTGWTPGDPQPTAAEQAAGWFSALDLAVDQKVITPCQGKFIRKASSYFIAQSFQGRLTPEEVARVKAMGDTAVAKHEEAQVDKVLKQILLDAGMDENMADVVVRGARSETEEVRASDFGQVEAAPNWAEPEAVGPASTWQTPASEDPSDREPANG